MTQNTPETFPRTIGMDLGVRRSSYAILNAGGEWVGEDSLKMSRDGMRQFFSSQPRSRLVIEACGPCRWVAELAKECDHEVVVANPREFRLISCSHKKSDRNDARILAEFGRVRPTLLHPIQLRGLKCQVARNTLRNRDQLVRQRTQLINTIRAEVRGLGESLPTCAAYVFHRKVRDQIPAVLQAAIYPLFDLLASLATAIKQLEDEIAELSAKQFSKAGTEIMRQVAGVGPITALAFVATIEDPSRFKKSRDVGPYVGLASKSRSSGSKNPELRISKRGDALLRRLLVNAATYIMRPNSEDSDLRRFGERIQGRGGQAARGKARIAVARKLSVLLHRLWTTAEVYDPMRNANKLASV